MKTKFSFIPYILTFIMVTSMVACATYLDEPEIIFPEITALTIGCWLAPQQIWKTSSIRFIALILIYSLLGVIMVKYIELPLYIKIISAFFMSLVGLHLSHTTFSPLISACILPIMMGTESWIYPIAATTMACLVICIQKILEHQHYIKKRIYHSSKVEKDSLFLGIKRLIVVALLLALALYIDYPLLIAPPLIVAFIELSGPHIHLKKKIPQLFLSTVTMACIGAYAKYFLIIKFGFSTILTVAIVTSLLLLLIILTRITFPPMGAITILPFIIDVELLPIYPLLIGVGFIILSLFALIISYQRTPLEKKVFKSHELHKT